MANRIYIDDISVSAFSRSLLVLFLAAFLIGCGPRKPVITDQPSFQIGKRYETVWVNPSIVYSDSLVTVIVAQRTDSILVDSSDRTQAETATIGFRIIGQDCNAVVNLAESAGRVLRPLFVQNLPPGFYQLTLHAPESLKEVQPLTGYLLKADYCGGQVSSQFFSGR